MVASSSRIVPGTVDCPAARIASTRAARATSAAFVEAGHLCQTFCLAATWLGLAPYCVMGLADSLIETDLGLDGSQSERLQDPAARGEPGRDHQRVERHRLAGRQPYPGEPVVGDLDGRDRLVHDGDFARRQALGLLGRRRLGAEPDPQRAVGRGRICPTRVRRNGVSRDAETPFGETVERL